MVGGPMLGGGRGMMPGTGLVRSGMDNDIGKKLPKGLVARVWREVGRPYRRKLGLLVLAISIASVLVVLPARLIEPIVNALSTRTAESAAIVTRYGLALIAVAFAAAGASLW
ncbi:MAG TPA: hypothetical protein VM307_15315, partial [Egibacteraceae bacterium]|nr:hypothetical protein [Egibacteraceae bacterium]